MLNLAELHAVYPPTPANPRSASVYVSFKMDTMFVRACLRTGPTDARYLTCFIINVIFHSPQGLKEEYKTLLKSPSGTLYHSDSILNSAGKGKTSFECKWNDKGEKLYPCNSPFIERCRRTEGFVNYLDAIEATLNWAVEVGMNQNMITSVKIISAMNFAADRSPIVQSASGGTSGLGESQTMQSIYLSLSSPPRDVVRMETELEVFARSQIIARLRKPMNPGIDIFNFKVESTSKNTGNTFKLNGEAAQLKSGARHLDNTRISLTVRRAPNRVHVAGCYSFRLTNVCINMIVLRMSYGIMTYTALGQFMEQTKDGPSETIFSVPAEDPKKFEGTDPSDQYLQHSLESCDSLQKSLDSVLMWALVPREKLGFDSVVLGVHVTAVVRAHDQDTNQVVGPVYTRVVRST